MGLNVKKKLMNTTHFYERPAPEVNDLVPWAFSCHKGKPFEDVSHVIWLLWIIGIRKEVMNSPNQCSKHIWLVLPSTRAVDQLCWWGASWNVALACFSQRAKGHFSTGNPDLAVVWKENCLLPVWKTFQKLSSYLSCLANCFGNRKGRCRPTEVDFLTVSARCQVYHSLTAGV